MVPADDDAEVVPAAGDAEVVLAAGDADTAARVLAAPAAGEVGLALDAGEVLPAAGDAPDAIAGLCTATSRSSDTLCKAPATTGRELCHVSRRTLSSEIVYSQMQVCSQAPEQMICRSACGGLTRDAPPDGEAVFVAGDEPAAGDAPEAGDEPAAGDAPPAAGEAPVAGLGDAAHTKDYHSQTSAYSQEHFLCSSTFCAAAVWRRAPGTA